MNTPEEPNANLHPLVDAQSPETVDANSDMSVDAQIQAELADLRALLDTAMSNVNAADDAHLAAELEYNAAADRMTVAYEAKQAADAAEVQALDNYRDALRRHGYVQTADGPRPR